MRAHDLPQVLSIDQVSFSMPWSMKAYQFELSNPMSLLWVAERHTEQQHQVVGFVVIWLIVDEVHIATIAVHPNFRGRRIAKALITTALETALNRGMTSATLEVRAGNHIAQKLYQSFGFQVVGQRPRYYRDNNEDALIMTIPDFGSSYRLWLKSRAAIFQPFQVVESEERQS